MTLILEIRSSDTQNSMSQVNGRPSEDALLASMTRQNLSVILNAMGRMELYWSGIGAVLNVLEQRESISLDVLMSGSGFTASRPRGNRVVPYISLPDQGVLRRFKTSRDHPQNVAPADENSLQNSIARDTSALDSGETRAERR